MRFMYLLLIVGFSFACGKIDKQEVTSEPIPGSSDQGSTFLGPALAIADMVQLPPCTASNQGQLVYVRAQQVFATCEAGDWVKIDIAAGGSSSSSGSAGLTNALYCSMTVSQEDLVSVGMDTAPEGGINFNYTVSQFANKTRYVQARISSSVYSYASGVFWTDKQVGYGKVNSDNIAFDVLGVKDFGFFYMTADVELTEDETNPYAVVYVDPAIEGGLLLKFDSKAECLSQTY